MFSRLRNMLRGPVSADADPTADASVEEVGVPVRTLPEPKGVAGGSAFIAGAGVAAFNHGFDASCGGFDGGGFDGGGFDGGGN